MAKLFDIKRGEFVEMEAPPKNRTRMIEIPEPNTILSGTGAPADDLGNPGDFYIDTATWKIYSRAESWSEPQPLIGRPGDTIKGDKGDKGDPGKDGRDGKDGIDGKQGAAGKDGKDGKNGTDGRNGLDGLSAPKLELGRSQTHIQWRYQGEKSWRDLMAIPKARVTGGGGAHHLDDLSDVKLTNLANGDTLVYNAATRQFENDVGGGSSEVFDNLSASDSILAGDTNTVFDNTGASALVVASLPAGARGLKYTFLVTDSDGFRIKAAGSDTIYVGTNASSAGGTVTSTKIGSAVVLYGRSGGWIAAGSQGIWVEA